MQELTPGTLVGPYTVEAEIGRGGMARVYRASQATLMRSVALKILSPDLAPDAIFVERFRREANIVAALEHPNIVPIYDVGEAFGHPFLAMRYVHGQPLADALPRDGEFSIDRTLDILTQIASALDYAHTQGVVHRDVKPANILLDENGHAYVADFGIALPVEGSQLTRLGQIAGTPAYMAPEQILGTPVTACTDLYALGILAFELLTGRVPFNADSDVAVLHKQAYEAPPSVRSLRPDLPGSVEAVLARMLSKRPDDRFASGAEFVAALGGLAVPQAAPFAAVAAPLVRPRSSRRSIWIPAVAASGVLVLFVSAIVISRGQTVPPVEAVPTVEVEVASGPRPTFSSLALFATAVPTNPPAAPTVVDKTVECARRMGSVDAVWNSDSAAAIRSLEDIVIWDANCNSAASKLYAARVNRAGALLRADQSSDAQTLLQQALRDNPSGSEAAVLARQTSEYLVGKQAVSTGDWASAIDPLARLHAEQNVFAGGHAETLLVTAYINYGNAFAAVEDWPDARDQYAAVHALKPQDPQIQQLLEQAESHLRSLQPVPRPISPQTQQGVLGAIQRANDAWTTARASLNPADLLGGVAGQELRDDTDAVNGLRQQGRYAVSHQVSFATTGMAATGPTGVVVDTRESWSEDIYSLASRSLITRNSTKSYAETYTVELQNGQWIVTLNQVH